MSDIHEGWGNDVCMTFYLSNGESMRQVVTQAELREENDGNLFLARQRVEQFAETFQHWRELDYFALVVGGETIYLNPRHIVYVVASGFDSWSVEE